MLMLEQVDPLNHFRILLITIVKGSFLAFNSGVVNMDGKIFTD